MGREDVAMRHAAIMALARLRWPVDEETRILPVPEPSTVVLVRLDDEFGEKIETATTVFGVSMGYGVKSNTLVVYDWHPKGLYKCRRRYLMI